MTHLEISLVKCIGYVNSIYSQMSLGFSNLIVLIYISRTEKTYVILNVEEKKKIPDSWSKKCNYFSSR